MANNFASDELGHFVDKLEALVGAEEYADIPPYQLAVVFHGFFCGLADTVNCDPIDYFNGMHKAMADQDRELIAAGLQS